MSKLTPELPVKTTFFVTGVNLAFDGDMHRRTLVCRLDSEFERPEERDGFAIPDLKTYALEHRGELLAAGLTILRYWFAAGKPQAKLPPMGSFERWSDIVRNAMAHASLVDPGLGRCTSLPRTNAKAMIPLTLIDAVESLRQPNTPGVKAVELANALNAPTPGEPAEIVRLREVLGESMRPADKGQWSSKQIGSLLNGHRGKVCAGRKLGSVIEDKTNVWHVVPLQNKTG